MRTMAADEVIDDGADGAEEGGRTLRKPSYPISGRLSAYLARFRRELELPVTYARLEGFRESVPLADAEGRDTLWETVLYPPSEMAALKVDLKYIYALLKVHGDLSVVDHLYVDRIDFCSFGNSLPFRIRIVNGINENPGLLLRQEGGRLARLRPGAGAPAVAEPARLLHLRVDAGRGARRRRAGRRLHPALARQERSQADPHRQGAGEVQRALLHPPARRHAQLQLRLRPDARLRGLAGAYPGDGLRPAVVQRAPDVLPAPVLPGQSRAGPVLHAACSTSGRRTSTSARSGRCSSSAPRPPSSAWTSCSTRWRATSSRPQANVITLRRGLAEHFDADVFLKCESMAALVRENLRQIRLADAQGRHAAGASWGVSR